MVRITIDLNRCQSYAQCCFLAPDVFELRGKEVLLYKSQIDDSQADVVLRSAAACPVQAILVESRLESEVLGSKKG